MSRDDLLTTNAKIMKQVAEGVRDNAPDAIVIIISNPLDAMVTLFQKVSGFPHSKVMDRPVFSIHPVFQHLFHGNSMYR